MKIAVFGSGAGSIGKVAEEKAREVGREIARRGHILITGGCGGLPYEAVLGAKEQGGETIGFSPAINLEDHMERFRFPVEGFNSLIFIPLDYQYKEIIGACLKYRNVSSVTECDSAVIISGRCGTLNEFTIAYDLGKNIGVLIGTGGITKSIATLVDDFNKPTGSRIIYEEKPIALIVGLEKLVV